MNRLQWFHMPFKIKVALKNKTFAENDENLQITDGQTV